MDTMTNEQAYYQEPYVSGANVPLNQVQGTTGSYAQNGIDIGAATAQGSANFQSGAGLQNGAGVPGGTAAGTVAGGAPLRHGLSSDVIGSPISVEEAFQGSMRGMLSREIGAYIAATFLMGNGELVRWEGRLYEVGNNYIVIYQQDAGRYVLGDINSLRFVEFSETGSRFALVSRPCTNHPVAW